MSFHKKETEKIELVARPAKHWAEQLVLEVGQVLGWLGQPLVQG